MTDEIKITINEAALSGLIKSNISCHANKTINQELIDTITMQIIESVDYFLNKREEVI